MSGPPQSQIVAPNLKLDACVLFADEPTQTILLQTTSLIGPSTGFLYNIARLKSLMLTPSRVSYFVAWVTNLFARVELEKTGHVSEYDPANEEDKPLAEISPRFVELLYQEGQKRAALAVTPEGAAKRLKNRLDATNMLQFLGLDSDFKMSLEAMLASYITGMGQ